MSRSLLSRHGSILMKEFLGIIRFGLSTKKMEVFGHIDANNHIASKTYSTQYKGRQRFVRKYLVMSNLVELRFCQIHWSYAQIIFLAGFAD